MTAVFHLPLPEGIGGPAPDVDVHQAAELAAEAVRALNHLTGSPGALEYPSDVHRILGSLNVLTARLPQLLGQLTLFLGRQHEAGNVVADYGKYAGRTDAAVTTTVQELAQAVRHAQHLHDALAAAQTACSGLSYTGGDDA